MTTFSSIKYMPMIVPPNPNHKPLPQPNPNRNTDPFSSLTHSFTHYYTNRLFYCFSTWNAFRTNNSGDFGYVSLRCVTWGSLGCPSECYRRLTSEHHGLSDPIHHSMEQCLQARPTSTDRFTVQIEPTCQRSLNILRLMSAAVSGRRSAVSLRCKWRTSVFSCGLHVVAVGWGRRYCC